MGFWGHKVRSVNSQRKIGRGGDGQSGVGRVWGSSGEGGGETREGKKGVMGRLSGGGGGVWRRVEIGLCPHNVTKIEVRSAGVGRIGKVGEGKDA